MSTWDPVTPGPGAYDPNKRYTQSSDSKGHQAQIKVGIPVNIAGAVARLVQSGYIPHYGTAQDVMRDALIHHLNRIHGEIREGWLRKELTMHAIHHDALERAARRQQYQDMRASVEAEIQSMLNLGRTDDLRDYLDDLMSHRDSIDREYREDYIAFIEQKAKTLNYTLLI